MMRIRKFFALPGVDQWFLIEVALLLGLIMLALRLFPFQKFYHWLTHRMDEPRPSTRRGKRSPAQIIWAVKTVSNPIKAANCLPQALTLQLLFQRAEYPAKLAIGVVKDTSGQLKAHAWVESKGHVVIGDLPNLANFTQFPSLARGCS